MENEIDTLKNPADILDGKIAESHRQIAKEFSDNLTKEQAIRIWKYFNKDITEMGKYFTYKFNSYYMEWTPVHANNTFISEWICLQIITKIADKNYYLKHMEELSGRILSFIDKYAGIRPDWDGTDEDDKYTSPDAYELLNCAKSLSHKKRPTTCFSEWRSGGYKPYDSKEGKEEHDAIIKEIYILVL